MCDEHAMAGQFLVPSCILVVLYHNILSSARVVIVEDTVGLAPLVDGCKCHRACLCEGLHGHPSHGFTFPCVIFRRIPTVVNVLSTVHQVPLLHGRITCLLCGSISGVDIRESHTVRELMTEHAYTVDAGGGPCVRCRTALGTYHIAVDVLSIQFEIIDHVLLRPDTVRRVAFYGFRIARIDHGHDIHIPVTVGVVL